MIVRVWFRVLHESHVSVNFILRPMQVFISGSTFVFILSSKWFLFRVPFRCGLHFGIHVSASFISGFITDTNFVSFHTSLLSYFGSFTVVFYSYTVVIFRFIHRCIFLTQLSLISLILYTKSYKHFLFSLIFVHSYTIFRWITHYHIENPYIKE